ncbi:MAG TPA: OmpA family protein [Terriglobales bacterium]|nr:OmpA family protein [Terriglobales bacterium]
MRTIRVAGLLALLGLYTAALSGAQEEHRLFTNDSGIQMIARTTSAVDYRRGDRTEVDMSGTNLMPDVVGKAKIINKRGLTDIHLDIGNLHPANALDAAYLTYVVWAISPEGNAKNLGELVEKDGKASIHTTTNLQSFALVVTAEPDFAVAQPSELVVAENSLRADTKGAAEPISVHYHVYPRSLYTSTVSPAPADIYRAHKDAPLDLLEARNAVRIAEGSHADQYSSDALHRAQESLRQAEEGFSSRHSDKTVETAARSAVQAAEEARSSAVHDAYQARIERERREAQERAETAQNEAQSAQNQAEQARTERESAEQRAQEERTRAEQARKQAQAEADRTREMEQQAAAARNQAEQSQQEAEINRQQADQAQQQAQQEAQRRAAAEQDAQQTAQQVEEARQRAQAAEGRAQQAEGQQQQLRQQMREQLNQVLETRDTARGLIVSMPDVLFNTGSASLKPTARERLAKVAGILATHPDIKVEVDGYTDSTGDPMFNERLSQERAAAVQSYLTQQGVPAASVSIHGFGEANPIASNDTPGGRQQNRRVEMIVTGESIGTQTTLAR